MNNKYLLYIGNSYPHKNLGRLIDAVILLNLNKDKQIGLKIVSARNEFIERLKGEIKLKNASEFVEIINFVDDKKLNNLYKNSIAFVFPTLSEGFGLPPMEAINAGTIAIVSNIPVLKEVYQDSVLYFDPLDPQSIARSIEKVINFSIKERSERLEKAQKFVKRYSWFKMAKETLNLYEKSSR